MSFGSSSSKSTPGYSDLYTDPKVQYMDKLLYGSSPYDQAGQWSKSGYAGGVGYKWNPENQGGTYGGAELPGSGGGAGGGQGGGQYLSGGQRGGGAGGYEPIDQNAFGSMPLFAQQQRREQGGINMRPTGGAPMGLTMPQGPGGGEPSGGYLGHLFAKAQGDPGIFSGDGSYSSEYSPYTDVLPGSKYSFNQNPTLKETSLSPDEYSASQDMITKNARRVAQGNIEKMRESDMYRGGGDLADYKADRENRNVNESTADSLRALSEDYQKRRYDDRQGVNRYAAEAGERAQTSQAGEDARFQDFEASQKAAQEQSRQFGEQSNQFGKQYQTDYMKNKLAEEAQNTSSLQELLKIMSGRSEAFSEGPTSSSKSKQFGMG